MKAVVLHYGKIAAMMFAGGVAYIGLGQRMNSQPAAQPLALTLSLLAVLVVAPATLALFLPNHRLARWAGISHGRLLSLSAREKAVLRWGRKCELKGTDVVGADYPQITQAELQQLLDRIRASQPSI